MDNSTSNDVKKKENKTFWDKYKTEITVGLIIFVLVVIIIIAVIISKMIAKSRTIQKIPLTTGINPHEYQKIVAENIPVSQMSYKGASSIKTLGREAQD